MGKPIAEYLHYSWKIDIIFVLLGLLLNFPNTGGVFKSFVGAEANFPNIGFNKDSLKDWRGFLCPLRES